MSSVHTRKSHWYSNKSLYCVIYLTLSIYCNLLYRACFDGILVVRMFRKSSYLKYPKLYISSQKELTTKLVLLNLQT